MHMHFGRQLHIQLYLYGSQNVALVLLFVSIVSHYESAIHTQQMWSIWVICSSPFVMCIFHVYDFVLLCFSCRACVFVRRRSVTTAHTQNHEGYAAVHWCASRWLLAARKGVNDVRWLWALSGHREITFTFVLRTCDIGPCVCVFFSIFRVCVRVVVKRRLNGARRCAANKRGGKLIQHRMCAVKQTIWSIDFLI